MQTYHSNIMGFHCFPLISLKCSTSMPNSFDTISWQCAASLVGNYPAYVRCLSLFNITLEQYGSTMPKNLCIRKLRPKSAAQARDVPMGIISLFMILRSNLLVLQRFLFHSCLLKTSLCSKDMDKVAYPTITDSN